MTAPLTPVGASGARNGCTAVDGGDAVPGPSAFVAVIVNVYEVPLVSPITVSGEAGPLAVSPPGDEVTVYDVTGRPPSVTGGLNATVTWWFPGVSVLMDAGPGTSVGVTAF